MRLDSTGAYHSNENNEVFIIPDGNNHIIINNNHDITLDAGTGNQIVDLTKAYWIVYNGYTGNDVFNINSGCKNIIFNAGFASWVYNLKELSVGGNYNINLNKDTNNTSPIINISNVLFEDFSFSFNEEEDNISFIYKKFNSLITISNWSYHRLQYIKFGNDIKDIQFFTNLINQIKLERAQKAENDYIKEKSDNELWEENRIANYNSGRKPIFREYFPEFIEQFKDFTPFIQAAVTIFDELFAKVDSFSYLVNADKVPEGFINALANSLGYEFNANIPVIYQREILKRLLSIYRGRGTETDILLKGDHYNNIGYLGGGVFVPGTYNNTFSGTKLSFPREELLVWSRSEYSNEFRYPENRYFRDGVISIYTVYLNDELVEALSMVVPAGVTLMFKICGDLPIIELEDLPVGSVSFWASDVQTLYKTYLDLLYLHLGIYDNFVLEVNQHQYRVLYYDKVGNYNYDNINVYL